jgi:pimeloyl-ACP methyl ester carboxylesterase
MPHNVVERRVSTSGPTLAIRDHEGGEPAILALHGLASNARWWDLVADRLAPRRRVIAVDLRGHGLSDRPDEGYDFDTVSGDLQDLCAQLHPRPLVVVGHSWGASVALAFGVNHPELTLGVVCVDGGATDMKAYFGPNWAMAEQMMKPPALTGITTDTLRAWMDSSPISEGADPDTVASILLGNFEDDGTGAGTLRARLSLPRHMLIARYLYELDGFELMSRLQRPLLLIPAGHPDHEDMPKVRAMDRAKALLGDRVRVVWVDGVHDIPVQRPDEVAAAIAGFADQLTAID